MSTTPNMRRKRPSGWKIRNTSPQWRKQLPPAMPTAWERFCYANHIDDPIIALQNGKRKLIRDWVVQNHNTLFVPELVLMDLKIDSSRWDS